MKKLKFLLLIISTILISCSKIDSAYNNNYAILFSNATTKAELSTVSETGYDNFLLYSWNSNNDTIMSPYLVNANAVNSYVYDNVPGQELKYYSKSADFYDFIGVIPIDHKVTLNDGNVTIDTLKAFTVDDTRVSGTLTAESPEEFLWAYKRVPKANYNSLVDLPFNHGNALIYLGFSSDRTDTKLLDYAPGNPGSAEIKDTTGVHFDIKLQSNVVLSSTNYNSTNPIPDALINEIKSYYALDGGTGGNYTIKGLSGTHTLRIVKDIPDAYKRGYEMGNSGKYFYFFDAYKYLSDNGYNVSALGKPEVGNYILIDGYINGSAYTVAGFNYGASSGTPNSKPIYEINITPAVPATNPIEGIRLFTADSTATTYCKHIAHTIKADAVVSSNGMTYINRTISNNVVTFSLPATTVLSGTPVWSPTTFYAIPGDANLNFLVVKLSYIYNGVASYDVRVPIKLPDGGLLAGKYYKYEIYITSIGNGTDDVNDAINEEDDIIIKGNPVIGIKLVEVGYTEGDNKKITI